MTLDRECTFCGAGFSYEYPGRGVPRTSCDGCRTQAARSRRYIARFPERDLARKKAWNEKNREKQRAWSRRYYRENPEKRRAYAKLYRENNQETVAAYMRGYRAARGPAVIASEMNGRARRKNAKGRTTKTQLASRFAYYGNCCAYCGGPAESVDHVIPLARGGTHWPANLRPACMKCNASKKDRSLAVFQGAKAA